MGERARVATARDVARLAGVSAAVVSYVLNGRRGGDDRISEETRQRVLAAVAELGYVPNQAARSLRRQQTERVCLVLPRLGAPYNDVMAADLQRVAERHGYSMVITVSGTEEQERRVLDQLRRGLADGVVFLPRYEDEQSAVGAITGLAETGVAVVVFSNGVAGERFDVVRTTDAAGCYRAMRYLIERGHRRIGYVGHLLTPATEARLASYRRALTDHGIAVDDALIRGGAATRDGAYRSAAALLAMKERPTALLVAADLGALGALAAARDLALRAPEDVAIIGVGNIPESATARPALTTVGPEPLDFTKVGELLFSRLRGEAPTEGRVLVEAWDLITRESA